MLNHGSLLPAIPQRGSNRTRPPDRLPQPKSIKPGPKRQKQRQNTGLGQRDTRKPVAPESTRPPPPSAAQVYLAALLHSQQDSAEAPRRRLFPPPPSTTSTQSSTAAASGPSSNKTSHRKRSNHPLPSSSRSSNIAASSSSHSNSLETPSSSSSSSLVALPPSERMTRKVCGQLSRCFNWRWLHDRILRKWLRVLGPTSILLLFRRLAAIAPDMLPYQPAWWGVEHAGQLQSLLETQSSSQGAPQKVRLVDPGRVVCLLPDLRAVVEVAGLQLAGRRDQAAHAMPTEAQPAAGLQPQRQQLGIADGPASSSSSLDHLAAVPSGMSGPQQLTPARQQQRQQHPQNKQQQQQQQAGEVTATHPGSKAGPPGAPGGGGVLLVSSHAGVAQSWRVALQLLTGPPGSGGSSGDLSEAAAGWLQLQGQLLPPAALLERAQFELMVGAACAASRQQLVNMDTQELVQLLWYLGRLRTATVSILEAWCALPAAQPQHLGPQQLSRCLRSFVALQVAPSGTWQQQLLEVVVAQGQQPPVLLPPKQQHSDQQQHQSNQQQQGKLQQMLQEGQQVEGHQQPAAGAAGQADSSSPGAQQLVEAAGQPMQLAVPILGQQQQQRDLQLELLTQVAVAGAAGCLPAVQVGQQGLWWHRYSSAVQQCITGMATPAATPRPTAASAAAELEAAAAPAQLAAAPPVSLLGLQQGATPMLSTAQVSCACRLAAALARCQVQHAKQLARWLLQLLQRQLAAAGLSSCTPAAAVDLLVGCAAMTAIMEEQASSTAVAVGLQLSRSAAAGVMEVPGFQAGAVPTAAVSAATASKRREGVGDVVDVPGLVETARDVLQLAGYELPAPAMLQLCTLLEGQRLPHTSAAEVAAGLEQGTLPQLPSCPRPVVLALLRAFVGAGHQPSLRWTSAVTLRTQSELVLLASQELQQLLLDLLQLRCFVPGVWVQALLGAVGQAAGQLQRVVQDTPAVLDWVDAQQLMLQLCQQQNAPAVQGALPWGSDSSAEGEGVAAAADVNSGRRSPEAESTVQDRQVRPCGRWGHVFTSPVTQDLAEAAHNRFLLVLIVAPLLPAVCGSSLAVLKRNSITQAALEDICAVAELGLKLLDAEVTASGPRAAAWQKIKKSILTSMQQLRG